MQSHHAGELVAPGGEPAAGGEGGGQREARVADDAALAQRVDPHHAHDEVVHPRHRRRDRVLLLRAPHQATRPGAEPPCAAGCAGLACSPSQTIARCVPRRRWVASRRRAPWAS
eukprot:scaffold682_cov355-Prasinococcus_capsulatus_cf.AAC.2